MLKLVLKLTMMMAFVTVTGSRSANYATRYTELVLCVGVCHFA